MKPLYFRADPGADAGALVPGTGEETPGSETTPPAAEPLNTDTEGRQGPPETIPYSRFKEVNDQLGELRPFKELADVGYDADSLRQLAEFDATFRARPIDTWLQIATQLDLPAELKSAIEAHATSDQTPTGKAAASDGAKDDGEIPEWAKKLQGKFEEQEEKELRTERQALLDGLLAKWTEMDGADGIKTIGDDKKLTYIMAHATNSGSTEDILNGARKEWLDVREEILESAVRKRGGRS